MENAKLSLQVDVGYNHAVTPKAQLREIPTLLDLPSPKMLVYPQETVTAEKFQAMIERGLDNSRVKDYFDLYYMRESFDFEGEQLRQAIKNTFNRRGTSLNFDTYPLGLTDKYIESNPSREKQWLKMIRQNAISNPPTLKAAIPKIAEFVMPVARAAKREDKFVHDWKKGAGWHPELKIDFDLLARQQQQQFPLPESNITKKQGQRYRTLDRP